MGLCSTPGLENAMSPEDSVCHSDQDFPSGSMALRCPHGHRLRTRPWSSMQPLMVTCGTDINTDPGCGRDTDTDMVLAAQSECHHGRG